MLSGRLCVLVVLEGALRRIEFTEQSPKVLNFAEAELVLAFRQHASAGICDVYDAMSMSDYSLFGEDVVTSTRSLEHAT